MLESAPPPAASSGYSLDLGCSRYRASAPSLPRGGFWLRRPVLQVLGGTAGGIIGALTQAGTSEEDAYVYAEGVRRGGILVSARVADADRARYEAILGRSAVNIRDRGTAWRKAGWQNFDPKAKPYTADEIRRSESFIELLRTTSLEDLSRLLISNRNFFRSAELIGNKRS